jgi:CubicO group peptidase (beta-lactamase class C family)
MNDRFPIKLHLSAVALFALVLSGTVGACDLDCSISKLLAEEKIAGAVYGVVDGASDRSGAAGVAHHPDAVPMRPDAKVHVGSIAKTFISLGVLRLVTQGRVELDAPLNTLLPEIRIDNPWEARTPVTLRHLLDHTAGLDDARMWQVFSRHVDPRAPLAGAFRGGGDLLRVRSEPGSQFSYSNMGYTLAAMAIESVTGERYESWLERELLGPLQMIDSTFEFRSQTGATADPRLAWGHHEDMTPAAALAVWVRPAAQFTTTANDMLQAARFLLSDGRRNGAVFIDADLLRAMARPTTKAAMAGLDVGYALGLATRDRHGALGVCHLGDTVGFHAALCIYPEQRKAFFFSLNTDSDSANYSRFDAAMVTALDVSSPVSPDVSIPAAPDWRGRYARAPARFEGFRYFDLLLDSVVLEVEGGALILRRPGGEPQPLVPVGPNLLRAPNRTAASHVLLTGTDGSAGFSDGFGTYRRVGNLHFFGNWLSLASGALGLLSLMILIPLRRLTQGEPLWPPASFAILLLLIPLPLFAAQPFVVVGDVTPASVALYLATVALPLAMVAHVFWAARHRHRVRAWPLHVAAALLVLQWCAALWVWDLLPLATWR